MNPSTTRRTLSKLALALAPLGLATDASAALLYGTLGFGGTSSTLVTLDPTTGALVSTIGSVGYTVSGLAYDPTSGTLYGPSRGNAGTGNLLSINTTTGAGTVVGSGFGGHIIAELAFGPGGQLYGWTESSDDLVTIDKTTAAVSVVGDSGLSTGTHGLAYDGSVMHFINSNLSHYTMDLGTGAPTFFNVLSVPTGDQVAHHGSINPDNGYYYGVDAYSVRGITVANLATGANVGSLDTPDDLHTLEFVVPEPGEYALLGSLALGAMACVRRVRRHAAQ